MTWRDVIDGRDRWSCEAADALAFLRQLPDRSVSLVLFSPPYEAARKYSEVAFALRGQAWVDWLRPVVVQAARVSAGLVLVNAAGQVRDHKYSPVMEWLVTDLTRTDGLVCGPPPYCWQRHGVPGSGSKHSGYHRRNWEPVYAFALPDRLPLAWHDHLAFGQPPKWGPGGAMSNRTADGARVNQWQGRGARNAHGVSSTTTRRRAGTDVREHVKFTASSGGPNGDLVTRETKPPAVANPGNVIRTGNGGNQLGHPLAHENEAPMNLGLAERFTLWFVPPDGILCDPFCGSGTSPHAARLHGRRFVGCDLRESQVALTAKRLATAQPNLPGA